jgi:hypothetical protein
MKKNILTIFCFAISNLLFGQSSNETYLMLVGKADSLYRVKDYGQSGKTYSLAFRRYGSKAAQNNLYDAACSWALCNNPDSAFSDLYHAVKEKNYYDIAHIATDADLTALHKDNRWPSLMDLVKQNKIKAEAHFNMPIVSLLDSVRDDDQRGRLKIDDIGGKYGYKSGEMDKLWQDIGIRDSINLTRVEAILDKYGWIGPEVIGDQGNLTLFLVIQHADQKTQEKYLPIMREAAKEGKAKASALAYLEDRVALGEGKKQIYGSQVNRDAKTGKYSFCPIEDEPNVDKRREAVGLGPLRYYANFSFNFDYQIPKE